ncbi:hypothetical protein [Nocardia macrotermitis]|uniref:Uncharacterized protein n=1 Tax=Nocardia macrotermitis TaxID=2585198 RepID=A0A7K0DA68_9NOCA|nr:hypothetical protein [Nocardia macrotermitis]MQY22673.1 hypothetical protein [Nocardia macrotermitis]
MGFVYLRTETELWTVGFYWPDGSWEPESDHGSKDAAAQRVTILNGEDLTVHMAELIKERDELKDQNRELLDQVQCLQWDLGALQSQHDRCPESSMTTPGVQ